jgi:hypothetical protein
MSHIEFFELVFPRILRGSAFIFLYFFIGFGPGFVLGLMLANRIFGEGLTYMDTHRENIKKASEHNAQWKPDNERWRQQ